MSTPHPPPNAYLTAEELALRLRVKPDTVRRWARTGVIPSIRIRPKTIRFDANAVALALASKDVANA